MSNITLSDRLSRLNDAFGNRLNRETSNEELCQMVSAVVSTISLEGKENKTITTSVIENKREEFFGFRVFPDAQSLDEITKALVANRASRGEFETEWKKIPSWVIEIDSRCFDDLRISFAPEELTALLLFEVVNIIYTDDAPSIIYDAYVNSYTRQDYFGRRGMEILYLLYEVAVLNACFAKNWIVAQDDPAKAVENAYEVSALNEYKPNVIGAIAKIVRNYGNNMVMDDMEKFRKVDQLITWANRFALDYVKRKNELKDDLLLRASTTSSLYLRANYIRILNTIGIELRERYTGSAIESIDPSIFNDKNFMQEYRFDFSMKSKTARGLETLIEQIPEHAQRAFTRALESAFSGKTPRLPSERDVDMIFVEIDRMENHFDRKYILDRIYRLMDRVVIFEEYYENNQSVLDSMRPDIDRIKRNLDEARRRVLAVRTFDKTYKVFVKVPAGYEG